jgi:fucose 4-O-acetylase-like acetyltransferase
MMARILFNLALNRWPDPRDRRWLILMPGLLVLAEGLGWMTPASPLGLLSVPMAMILLWVGALWPRLHWRNLWIAPLGLLALAGLAGWLPTLNMKAADYGWPLLSIASGIATSLLLFRLSARLAPVSAPLAALGRASLVIMYLHVAIIHYGTPYLARPWLLALALLAPLALWHFIRLFPRLSRWML